MREATCASRREVGRVPRTPLQEPPVLATQALWLAHERARRLGRWVRSLHVPVGLPEGHRGAAGPPLGADRDRPREEALASPGGDRRRRPGR